MESEYDTTFQKVWPNCPNFVLCKETGQLQDEVTGLCSVHKSDGCLANYVQVSAVRTAIFKAERNQ